MRNKSARKKSVRKLHDAINIVMNNIDSANSFNAEIPEVNDILYKFKELKDRISGAEEQIDKLEDGLKFYIDNWLSTAETSLTLIVKNERFCFTHKDGLIPNHQIIMDEGKRAKESLDKK